MGSKAQMEEFTLDKRKGNCLIEWNEKRVVQIHSGLWHQETSSFPMQSETDYLLSKERLGRVRAWRKLKKVIEEIIGEFQTIE